ncbi:glycosyltransferase family 4 protein [Brevibacillus sedimenti]|uniref:glycosyltransferase family 4 protein n=1 Tax=Brevibacillus sedimenti TaxID=2613334 RepID=UPI001E287712|nr:glycosyltransferase [Anoxybacillus sediminis]
MLEEWRQMAEQRGLASRVRFLGFVDDDRRNLLFRMAAAAVFPSLYEPFGIVALEAMALGTPVIVADTGGLREIVRHGENGLTFYTGNANSLADQLCWLLHCPDERERLVRTAREEILCQYDWNRLALQTMDLYRSLGSAWATSI